jgi:hypothetical protein
VKQRREDFTEYEYSLNANTVSKILAVNVIIMVRLRIFLHIAFKSTHYDALYE